jgi:hypothetical protein
LTLLRKVQGTFDEFLNRSNAQLPSETRAKLADGADRMLEVLGLPEPLLAANWNVDALGLARMLTRLREGVRGNEIEELMPVQPLGDVYKRYAGIFYRMYREIGGLVLEGPEAKGTRGFINHVVVTSLKWMQGDPLRQIISEAVSYRVGNTKFKTPAAKQAAIDRAIRATFELIEQTIRFRLVQWSKAYVDLLRFVLAEAGRQDLAQDVYDFALDLELGVSSSTGRALVELGLSRMAASTLSGMIADSALNAEKVKAWIRGNKDGLLNLSPIILRELEGKGLLAVAAA